MSIVDQAKYELEKIDFGEHDSAVMVDILEKFFGAWNSGGAVAAAQPVLNRLIAGTPLSPLTGEDDEWIDVSDEFWQNRRCSTVFKEKTDDRCYDIDSHGRPTITFPYQPEKDRVDMPIYTVDLNDD